MRVMRTGKNFVAIYRLGRLALVGILLAESLWAENLTAQQRTLELDPAQTQIYYVLGGTLHTVHGLFQMRSGVINFDPATGAASGAIIVDAASGNSGTESRDKKMDKDVLQTEQYHEIAFYPKKVIGSVPSQGQTQIQVQGVFRLHGSDHEMTMVLPVQINGTQVRANSQFVVPYVAWGMKDPSTLFLRVAKEVQIRIETSGTLK
jgi:polyisoprenoid-binding protein YceI